MLLIVDAHRTIRRGGVNTEAERLVGSVEDELVGKHFADVFVAAEARAEATKFVDRRRVCSGVGTAVRGTCRRAAACRVDKAPARSPRRSALLALRN